MTIRVYRDTDFGAPVLDGNGTNNTVNLLDKCLVDGFGDQTVTITRVGTVATITYPSAHGLKHQARHTISGADQGDYNGEFQVTEVTSTTATFTVAGSPTTPATGTINCKVTASGWTKEYSGTGKAAFKQGAAPSMLVRILDDGSGVDDRYVQARAYQSMTDVDTGTDPFPTVAQLTDGVWTMNSVAATATTRAWLLVATEDVFYLMTKYNSVTASGVGLAFGSFDSLVASDTKNVMLIGSPSSANAGSGVSNYAKITTVPSATPVADGQYLAASPDNVTKSIVFDKLSNKTFTNWDQLGRSAAIPYPMNVADGLLVSSLTLHQGPSEMRGTVKLLLDALHNNPLTDGDTYLGSGVHAGKLIAVFDMYNTAQVHIICSDSAE